MRKHIPEIIIILLAIGSSFAIGYGLPHSPEEITKVIYDREVVESRIEVPYETIKVINQIELVEVPVYPIYPGINLRPFANTNELKEWLRQDKTNELEYVFKRFDCENFAIALSIAAAEDGYYMGIKGSLSHVMNFTIIDGYMYKIEPQTDDLLFWHKAD